MIIELVTKDGVQLCLIHINLPEDDINHVEGVFSSLEKSLPGFSIHVIPNGQPCPTNPLPKIMICNQDNHILLDAIVKIHENNKGPGSFIFLSKEEMDAVIDAQKNGEMITL